MRHRKLIIPSSVGSSPWCLAYADLYSRHMNSTAANLRNTWKAALGSSIETLAEEREPPKELLLVSQSSSGDLGDSVYRDKNFHQVGLSRLESCFLIACSCMGLQWFAPLNWRSICSSGQYLCQFLSKHHSKNTVGQTAANLWSSSPVSSKQWHRHTRTQRKVSLYLGGCVVDYSLPRGGGCWLLHCEDLLS